MAAFLQSRRTRRALGAIIPTVVILALTQIFPQAYPLGILTQGAILGLASGLLALGLVLVYRTSRVINFAYGAMGSCAAEVGVAVWDRHRPPWLLCVLIAVIAGVFIGIFVDWVMRRFANAPRLVVTVATIGLLQILVGLQFGIAFWAKARLIVAPFKTDLSAHSFTIGTSVFDANDVTMAILGPLAVLGLAWFLLRTDAGGAVRAVADNRERASLLGIPIWRLTRIVWILVAALAGAVMALSAPANGLPVSPFVSVGGVFMPALAAAVIAKMDDLPLAFTAGIGLGVLHGIVAYNVHKSSVTTVVLLAVVLIALLGRKWDVSRAESSESSWSLSGASRPLRPSVARLPEIRIGRGVMLGILATIAIAFPLIAQPSRVHTVSGYLIYGIVVVSLVILSGWAGTISLGQVAIVGVGAVVAGDLIVKTNLDLFAAVVLAGLAGAVVSVIIALPALRVRPLFLAVTTLLFAAAMNDFVLNPANFPKWIPADIRRPVLWKRYAMSSETTMYFVILAVLALVVVVAHLLRNGRPGRLLLAARDNDKAAIAMAIPVTKTRLGGMALAGLIAGVAGALAGVLETGVGASSFPAQTSVLVFSMAVVGGLSSISGALAGVAAVELLIFGIGLTSSSGSAAFGSLGTGALMLFVLLVFPGGIGQAIERLRDGFVGLVARRRGLTLSVGAAAGSDDMGDEPTAEVVPVTAGAPSGVLSCRGLEASYGPLQVLFGVDMDVSAHEVVALLGTNGAGKSTVFRVITGLLPATGGDVFLNGQPITSLATDEIARRGVAMMPGGRCVFPTMTVRENLRLACWLIRKDHARANAAVEEMLGLFPILEERGDQLAGNLSGGEQQQLSLAMAFITKPSVLLIDELSLGLAPTIVAMLCDKVHEIHATGTTIVAVEQSVNVALNLAQRALFLEKGSVRFAGSTVDLYDRPDILRSVFIGQAPKRIRKTRASNSDEGVAPIRDVSLKVTEVSKSFGGIRALDRMTLDIQPGTITGLIGHNGAGKTTLFDVISGFYATDGGRIELGDEDITDTPATRRAIQGLGRSFQEARLFPSLTVTETITVAHDRHRTNRDWVASGFALPAAVNADAESFERANELIDLLGLTHFASTPIADLSTGTRRIVELACALAMDPAVLLLDEPSAGVAQKDTEALGPLLRRIQAATGAAIVIIEHDMALLTGLCDELVALENGSVIFQGKPADVLAHPRVIESYLGVDESAIQRSGAVGKRPRKATAKKVKTPA